MGPSSHHDVVITTQGLSSCNRHRLRPHTVSSRVTRARAWTNFPDFSAQGWSPRGGPQGLLRPLEPLVRGLGAHVAPRGASRNPQRVPVSPGTCPGQGAVGPGQPPRRLRETRVRPSAHCSKAFPGSGQTWLEIKSQKGQRTLHSVGCPSRTKTDTKADPQNAVSRMSDPQLPDVLKSQPQARAPGGTAPAQGPKRAARHGAALRRSRSRPRPCPERSARGREEGRAQRPAPP